ncbi:MAG: hypothetical protein MR820_09230, partial [Prevotella sp.]|nr:hypothetical protein [Prevotella sp.]
SAVPFSGKRVQRYSFFLNYQNFWGYFFEKYALFAVSLMLVNGNSKKWRKYRAVTRPTLGLFLNEECRMKNEEWELHFLILVKREKGKGKNRADGI